MNSLREDVEDLTAKLARELGFEHITRHHETSAETPAAAVTIEPTTGGPVISVAEIENDILHFTESIGAKFQQVDKAAIGKLEAIKASPIASEAFEVVYRLTGVSASPELDAVLTLLKALAPPPAAAAEPSFTPGPQVAGQA